MISTPPGLLLLIGGMFIPFLPGSTRQIWMLILLGFSASSLLAGFGTHLTLDISGYEFIIWKSDALSMPFAIVFHIAAFLNILYGWHEDDWKQHTSIFTYAGAAILAIHAGDFLTLFLWWELTVITSVFLILASNTQRAKKSALRYLIIQFASGALLISGTACLLSTNGQAPLELLSLDNAGAWFIFFAFGIKAAFPLLNGWLQDAYPEATVIGAVALSAFTTKLAIYALARTFAGTEHLIWIGIIMTAFPVFFAVIENDLRRVLSYSLNNQLGFMVVAIGIGTEIAINGAVAHAFVHIIYKSLLFMSMGAVLYRVGTIKASELGGLYKYMPITAICCIIGAMSISAFPLFSGFVAKSLIMVGVVEEGYIFIYIMLLFASAGVLEHSGIKIPYFAFFGHESVTRTKEAPKGMLAAMLIASFLCICIGIFPNLLFSLLPYDVNYHVYTSSHVIGQLQLLIFAILAFAILIRFKLYPPEIPSTVLNFDWLYRRLLLKIAINILTILKWNWEILGIAFTNYIMFIYMYFYQKSKQAQSNPVTVGSSTVLILFSLGLVLIFNYFLF